MSIQVVQGIPTFLCTHHVRTEPTVCICSLGHIFFCHLSADQGILLQVYIEAFLSFLAKLLRILYSAKSYTCLELRRTMLKPNVRICEPLWDEMVNRLVYNYLPWLTVPPWNYSPVFHEFTRLVMVHDATSLTDDTSSKKNFKFSAICRDGCEMRQPSYFWRTMSYKKILSIMICLLVRICANDENPYKDQSPGLLNI